MPFLPAEPTTTIEDQGITAEIVPISAAITSTVLLDANPGRKGATVFNNSTARLYLALSETASVEAFTVPLDSGDYWQLDFDYRDAISGIWTAANGNAMITELM